MFLVPLALTTLTALSFLSPSVATGGNATYTYDSTSDVGPSHWGELTNSSCDGHKNSPIAVTTHSCDTFADYTLTVS
jgi:carbonic anhydrase